MGIQTHIYVKSRRAVDVIIECQRDPALKGLPSRVCDEALQKLWTKMKGIPADGESLDISDIYNPNWDNLSDKKLRALLDLVEVLNRRKRNNLNLERAYKCKSITNL